MEDLTNWPQESGKYKIVQMEVDGEPCIRFPPWKTTYAHSLIVMNLARTLQREYPFDPNNRYKDPLPESEWYKVVGAGKARIDIGNKVASLYGESEGYGIGINLDHLSHLRPLHPDWKIVAEI